MRRPTRLEFDHETTVKRKLVDQIWVSLVYRGGFSFTFDLKSLAIAMIHFTEQTSLLGIPLFQCFRISTTWLCVIEYYI